MYHHQLVHHLTFGETRQRTLPSERLCLVVVNLATHRFGAILQAQTEKQLQVLKSLPLILHLIPLALSLLLQKTATTALTSLHQLPAQKRKNWITLERMTMLQQLLRHPPLSTAALTPAHQASIKTCENRGRHTRLKLGRFHPHHRLAYPRSESDVHLPQT